MITRNEPKKDLLHFSKKYDEAHASKAYVARGEFISKFPISSLKRMKLDSYVAGKGTYSFCNAVESKTDGWARIRGATSFKFGIYYGVTKSDNSRMYRFASKFGNEYKEAFKNVKISLLKLLADAEKKKFKEIDENPISQMFKAKIISLYYPEIYINICSEEHIKELAYLKGLPDGLSTSHYQNLLLEDRNRNKESSSWSNPKYMMYLYEKYIRKNLYSNESAAFRKPKKISQKDVNFSEIQKIRDELGKKVKSMF